jgi:hypothetical protein
MGKAGILYFMGLLLLLPAATYAQAWTWGARGGSTDLASLTGGPYETVVDMTADNHGNLYVLSNVYNTSLTVGSRSLIGYGNEDLLVASYTCDGELRWVKDLGTAQNDQGYVIKADSMGGVYIAGALYTLGDTAHISTDTLVYGTYQDFFIVKYDTSGNFQWLNLPQPDTMSYASLPASGISDMDVDRDGNSYVLMTLPPGSYEGGAFTVATEGAYMLKLNNAGGFVSARLLPITADVIANSGIHMRRDHRSGRFYLAGGLFGGTLAIGGQSIGQMYVCSLDSTYGLIWLRQNNMSDSSQAGFANRPVIDSDGNLYLLGGITAGDTFNNYVFSNPFSTLRYTLPFVVKMDKWGGSIWTINAWEGSGQIANAIGLNNGEVVVSGGYLSKMAWPYFADTLSLPLYNGYDVFLARINATTGLITQIDTLTSNFGYDELPSQLIVDQRENVYIGGFFTDSFFVGPDTLVNSGGESDFFVVKYGFDNCNCDSLPVSSFTYVNNTGTSFTFTGTKAGIDSVVWNFGDGSRETTMDPEHKFELPLDSFEVCATVYTSCGVASYCREIRNTTRVQQLLSDRVSIYPNPAGDVLYIGGAAMGTTAVLRNTLGEPVKNACVDGNIQTMNLSGLAQGLYILTVYGVDGLPVNTVVEKQ